MKRQQGKNAQAHNMYKVYDLIRVERGDPLLWQESFWKRLPHWMTKRVHAWIHSMTPGQRPVWFEVVRRVHLANEESQNAS